MVMHPVANPRLPGACYRRGLSKLEECPSALLSAVIGIFIFPCALQAFFAMASHKIEIPAVSAEKNLEYGNVPLTAAAQDFPD